MTPIDRLTTAAVHVRRELPPGALASEGFEILIRADGVAEGLVALAICLALGFLALVLKRRGRARRRGRI